MDNYCSYGFGRYVYANDTSDALRDRRGYPGGNSVGSIRYSGQEVTYGKQKQAGGPDRPSGRGENAFGRPGAADPKMCIGGTDDLKQLSIIDTAKAWSDLTHVALGLKKIPAIQIQNVLKKTYEILFFYHRQECAPKLVSKLLLEMDEFLYFVSLMENCEVEKDFYYYQAVFCIAKALKQGYFLGQYDCAFPMLKFLDPTDETKIIDLENGKTEGFF